MLPPRKRLDPDGYYARLGVEPSATHEAIVTAYRGKVRLLHPDVPRTGNAEAFLAVKQAYDAVSNLERRRAYDQKAQDVLSDEIEPDVIVVQPATYPMAAKPIRQPRFSDLPPWVWGGVAALLVLCLWQITSHVLSPAKVVNAGIRPNAATVEPLSPSAHQAVLYGPNPVRLAGTPNFYVIPSGTPAVLWRQDKDRNALVSLGQLPPFSAVQAVRQIRQSGMLEVLVNDQGNGFISADHLTPGSAVAARLAYCSFNSGPLPYDGELLERRQSGGANLALENHAVQPAVVKLRDAAGTVAVAVFLSPGGHVDLDKLPEGLFRPEFAIGEIWSRACNMFAAGMRARRMNADVRLPGDDRIVLAPDAEQPETSEISDQAFQQN